MTDPASPVTARTLSRLERAYLTIGALVYLAVGVPGLLAPEWLMRWVDVRVAGPSALGEIRAAYGGHMLALGMIMLVGLLRPPWRGAAVALFVVSAGGFFVGRLVGVLADGAGNTFTLVLWAMEGAGLAGGLALMALGRRARA